MKKKLLLFFLAIGAWTGAMSQDVGYIMRVNLVNGTVDEYLVADQPRVTYPPVCYPDSVLIQAQGLSTLYFLNEIESYTFVETSATGIEDVAKENGGINVSIQFTDGETVIIRNISSDTPVSVYSIDGRRVEATVVHTKDGADVSLAALPMGYYVINIKNKKSIKVLKQ